MKTNPYKYETVIISLIISFGLLLRGFNINFNDFWSDEMVSFYLSNPNLEFLETIKLNILNIQNYSQISYEKTSI